MKLKECVSSFLEQRDTYRLLKKRYNKLVNETYDTINDLMKDKRTNIFNHSKYISQKQKVNKLKESYKNEINNKIKSISYNYDLFNVDDYLFLTEKCDSEFVKMFSNQGYWSLENFYFTKDFTDKIDYYKKNIKKYVKSYNRYLNKMKNVIDCYDKRFCSKNKYDKLDLTK